LKTAYKRLLPLFTNSEFRLDSTNNGVSHRPKLTANCKVGFSLAAVLSDGSAERFLVYFSFFVFLGFLILSSSMYESFVSFSIFDTFNMLFAFHLDPALNGFGYQKVYATSSGVSASPSFNHLPTAYSGVAYTSRDTPVLVTLKATDQDGDALTFFPSLLSTKTAHGKLGSLRDYSTSSSMTTARITYFPDPGYSGTDNFAYQTADKSNAVSNVASISLIIR
jgi:hypothetical protein